MELLPKIGFILTISNTIPIKIEARLVAFNYGIR